MPCGQLNFRCGKNQFGLLTVGRLAYLNGVPSKPAPTRDYSSRDALARNIRRRTSVKNANGVAKFGPLFGLRKKTCIDQTYQNPNSGTGTDVVYWRRVFGGRTLTLANVCNQDLKPCKPHPPTPPTSP
jgi:hypothetical protein